jgi:hypothetical protein
MRYIMLAGLLLIAPLAGFYFAPFGGPVDSPLLFRRPTDSPSTFSGLCSSSFPPSRVSCPENRVRPPRRSHKALTGLSDTDLK